MNHYSTNFFLLLAIAASIMPLNTAAAQQIFPPIPQSKSGDSDPVADADFYLQKSKTQIAELQAFVDSLRQKNNLQEFPYRPVMFTKRDVRQAFHTLNQANDQIKKLPNHIDGIRHQTHQRLTRKLQRLDNYLETIRTILEASLDPQAFPDLKADAVRFRGLGIMLTNLDSFKTDPTLAAAIYRQLPSAQQEVDRILSKYDLIVRQETIPGIQLAGLGRYFQSKLKSFQAIAKQYQQALPQQIKNSLNQITKQLKQPALQSNSPNEASVDLQTQLRQIKANLELLEALNPQASNFMMPLREQILELQARFQDIEPVDDYAGNDRDDLFKTLVFPDHQPADNNIRIPTAEWTRRTYWQYNGLQWREIDRSILRFYVLPPNDGNARSQWQEYSFSKDHLNDDRVSVQSVR